MGSKPLRGNSRVGPGIQLAVQDAGAAVAPEPSITRREIWQSDWYTPFMMTATCLCRHYTSTSITKAAWRRQSLRLQDRRRDPSGAYRSDVGGQRPGAGAQKGFRVTLLLLNPIFSRNLHDLEGSMNDEPKILPRRLCYADQPLRRFRVPPSFSAWPHHGPAFC